MAKTTPPSATLPSVHGRSEQLSEQKCRRIISRYREKLEWLVRIPELEETFAEGLRALDLPAPRRGINLRAVLDTLPLESKFKLIIWAFRHYKGPFPGKYAVHLDGLYGWGIFTAKKTQGNLSARRLEKLNENFQLDLAKEHRQYKHAQTILFRRYQSLLHKLVNRLVFDYNKRSDAYQEASLGLVHAIDKVEDSSASFGSYARTWISRHIRNFLMEAHFPVHVPINLASRILRQDEPGPEDDPHTAEAEQQQMLRNLAKPGISLDEITDDDEQPRQFPDPNVTSPSDSSSQRDTHRLLHECLSQLTDKQREVLALRYGLEPGANAQTLSVIAQSVGISHQQVSMREKRALQKLESTLRPLLAEMA